MKLTDSANVIYSWYRLVQGKSSLAQEFIVEDVPSNVLDDIKEVYGSGGIVVVPTDTVYGLSCILAQPAIDKIFEIKRRPRDVAFPVLCGSYSEAQRLVDLSDEGVASRFQSLNHAFWPGPLTIVTSKSNQIGLDFGGSDHTTIGVRVGDAALVRLLTNEVGPLVATSANLHGQPPMTKTQEVLDAKESWMATNVSGVIISSSPCVGISSTVVDIRGQDLSILRDGPIARADLLGKLNG